MAVIASVLQHIIIDKVLRSDALLARKTPVGRGFVAFIGFLVCLGAFFWLYALNLELQSTQPPQTAAIMAGVLAFSLAFLVGGAAYLYRAYRNTRRQKIQQELSNILQNAFDIIDEEFGTPISSNPKVSVLVASIAGFVTGEKFL